MAGGFEHFHVETGALFNTLGFQQFIVIFEVFDSFGQFFANAGNCLRNGRARRDVMIGRVNGDFLQRSGLFAGQAVKFIDVIYLIAEEGYSPGPVFIVGGKDVQRVSLNPESAADEIRLIPFVLQFGQAFVNIPRLHIVADGQRQGHGCIRFNVAQTVNAGDRGHDNDVVVFQNVTGGRVAHAVNLLV